jgi:LacI family transcriptional regulator
MTTIKDVARVAGVSIATVSALLNGTARVSEKLSQRIWAAIESTGYSPHGIARSLRLGRTRSIGLVVGDISNPFFTSLAKTVEARALEAGYMVIVANSDEEPEKELKLLKLLREQRVAGILLTPSGHDPSYLLALSRTTDIPIVLLDRLLPQSSFDAVVVDNLAAARMATDYLVRLNHRRIAMVIGKQHIWTMEQRLRGYRESLKLAGIEPDSTLELIADTRIETAYEVVQRLLAQPNPPTAIFAANILMMLGAIEAVMDMGFRCPEQVSLAGIDDFPGSSAIRPLLTTVTQPIEELAERAVGQLLGRIGQVPEDPEKQRAQTIMLMPRLLIRDSCARLVSNASSNVATPR